jgi:hypothetical protein
MPGTPHSTEPSRNWRDTKDGILRHQFDKRLIFKENQTLSGFKNTCKKIHETRKLAPIREYHLVERKNVGRKPDNSSLRRSQTGSPAPFV